MLVGNKKLEKFNQTKETIANWSLILNKEIKIERRLWTPLLFEATIIKWADFFLPTEILDYFTLFVQSRVRISAWGASSQCGLSNF